MSVMVCNGCGSFIDTDDCEGVWEHKGTRFWCERCTEAAMADPAANTTIMENLKHQDPDAYQMAIEEAQEPQQ